VDALTYAGAVGIDVVNMSFFVDPWLYNCSSADDDVDAPAGKPTADELTEQRQILEQSAADHAGPVPATVEYTIVGRPASWNATCTGTPTLNNFYGNGLVDAAAAVALAAS
jgi:hypothetical protein